MYVTATVAEVDVATGTVRHAWGTYGDDPFDPPAFDMQHAPNWTMDGTLLVSTHVPDADRQQRDREFVLDDASGRLTEVWSYGEGVDEYATYAGEAFRLENGNTLINYGSGGNIREVTADGRVAWSATFEGRLVGHTSLLAGLEGVRGE